MHNAMLSYGKLSTQPYNTQIIYVSFPGDPSAAQAWAGNNCRQLTARSKETRESTFCISIYIQNCKSKREMERRSNWAPLTQKHISICQAAFYCKSPLCLIL